MADNDVMTTQDTLLAYSEWLDMQGIIVPTDKDGKGRSHDALAQEFIERWESDPNRATLAGRLAAKWAKAMHRLVDRLVETYDHMPLDERIRNGL